MEADEKEKVIEAMREAALLLLEAIAFLDPPDRSVSMVRGLLADALKLAYSDLSERRREMESAK